MDLQMDKKIAENYNGESQKIRVITENWVSQNLFCPYCGNQYISQFENNRPVADFYCPHCIEEYELKSKKPVPEADIEDIDMEFVNAYIQKIVYSKSPLEYLKENKWFVKEKKGNIQVSSAAILLFGKNSQLYFPRTRVRFIRYEGIEEKFGTEMNVIKDLIF